MARVLPPRVGNFEADLSMMVSRPYEANLGHKKAKYNFSKFAKIFLVEKLFRPGRDRILQGEGVKLEAGEVRRGPRRAK